MVRYRVVADIDITGLDIEYEDIENAVKHYKKWLDDKEVLNVCIYKVIYEKGIEKSKEFINL